MFPERQTTCWIVTDGKAGLESQCLGLAEALGVAATVKRVKLRAPWRQLSPYLRLGLSFSTDPAGDPVAPPWPDLLIAAGRASVPAAIMARRTTRDGKPPTFTVHIQNPVISPSHFDLVIAPLHDNLSGPNVLSTRGSLHRVTPELIAREAEKFRDTFAHLPSPRIAVMIGGASAAYHLGPKEMGEIAARLAGLQQSTGDGLMVTASRRTGEVNRLALEAGLKGTSAYVWNGQGPNPYFAMLGLADALLVTCDSVNMVSEACTTGKPVHVIDLPGGSDKFRRFHQALRDANMTRPFASKIEHWTYAPLDDTKLAAARVREMMATRR